MQAKTILRYAATLCCLATFAWLFATKVPEPVGAQLGVIGLFLLLALLPIINARLALPVFAFLIPLVGIIPRALGSPRVPVLIFAFLGFSCGVMLRAILSRKARVATLGSLASPLSVLAALTLASGTITALRFANFYPFSGEPFRDWIVNGVGLMTTEALNNTVTVALAYISGILLLFTAGGLMTGSGGSADPRALRQLAWAVVLAGFVANLFALWQLVSGRLLVIGFVTGTYTDSNALGVCSALIFPYSMGLLLISGKRARVFLIICALASVAVTILARSRAGVLGILLFAVGLALWLRRAHGANSARKDIGARALKGFAVLAAILVLTLALEDITRLSKVPVIGDALLVLARPSEDSLRYLLRHRLHQWAEALRMCRRFAWSGVGLGAYIVELPNFYLQNKGRLFLIDTAGNLFLQVASELGFLGLILLLWFGFGILKRGHQVLAVRAQPGLEGHHRLLGCIALSVFIASFLLLFGAHILFFEYNYLLAISVAGLFGSTRLLDEAPPGQCGAKRPGAQRGMSSRHVDSTTAELSGLLMISVAVVSGILLLESLGPLSIEQRRRQVGWQVEYGLYPKESWDGKFHFWWTQKETRIRLVPKGRLLEFSLFCAHPDADRRPVSCALSIDDKLAKTVELTKDRWTTVRLPITGPHGREIALRITVDRTFNPKSAGISGDERDLGVAIARLSWPDNGRL